MSSTPLTPAQINYAQTALWKSILKQSLADLRCAAPGIIQSFDPVNGATVQIAITELVRTNGLPQTVQIAPISNVPVVMPRGGGFSLTLPIAAGDECLLVFSDSCIDLWWARGGVQDQFELRRHDLSDCFCIPGPWSKPKAISDYSTSSLQVRSDDGQVSIELTPGNNINIFAAGDVTISANGQRRIPGLSAFPNTAAAIIGGLTSGDLFRSTGDPSAVCVVP